MCKSEAESGVKGGIRCKLPECENGSARQAYRIIATMKKEYENSITVSPTPQPNSLPSLPLSLEEKHALTFERKHELDIVKEAATALQKKQDPYAEEYSEEYRKKLVELEEATTSFGESISSYVEGKTGITSEVFAELHDKAQEDGYSNNFELTLLEERINELEDFSDLSEEEEEEMTAGRATLDADRKRAYLESRGWSLEMDEKYEEYRTALYSSLGEHRSFGEGQLNNLTSTTDEEAAAALNQAAVFLPSEWIETHNRAEQSMHVELSDARSYFLGKMAGDDDGEEIHNEKVISYATEEHPHGQKPAGEGWELVDFTYRSTSSYIDGQDVSVRHQKPQHDSSLWRKNIGEETKTVYRNFVKMKLPSIDEDADDFDRKQDVGAAVHEMMHRMEAEKGLLGSLQGAFYQRRTAGFPATTVDRDIETGELVQGIPDNFVVDYLGKVNNKNKSYEILSVGMQAIADGPRYGAMMGISGQKEDKDTKNFIYGILGGM